MNPYRKSSGADVAAELARLKGVPTLDLAAEVRHRTGMWFDSATSTWRGTNGATVTAGMVQSVLKAGGRT